MKRLITASALVALAMSTAAQAGNERPYRDAPVYDYAKVVKVQPVVRQVKVVTPRRSCWEETVVEQRPRRSTAGATLVGGLIGGAIGHQFGSGSGQAAMTAMGAIVGSSIGRDAALQNRGVQTVSYPVERCEVREQVSYTDRVEAYQVTYRYQGRLYSTRMPYDPGKRLKVQVDVRPVSGKRDF